MQLLPVSGTTLAAGELELPAASAVSLTEARRQTGKRLRASSSAHIQNTESISNCAMRISQVRSSTDMVSAFKIWRVRLRTFVTRNR